MTKHTKQFRRFLHGFFENPNRLTFDVDPDWDAIMRAHFDKDGSLPMVPPETQAELKMRLMELRESRKANGKNVEMLWRAQVLTAITTLVSFLGVTIAAIAVIVTAHHK